MQAAYYRRYGPPSVVSLTDLPDPTPAPEELLIQIEAAGLTVGDARIRAARAPGGMAPFIRLAFGLTAPRRPILGREYAGTVVACGSEGSGIALGSPVFGITDGLRFGAHAERVAVKRAGLIVPRPDSLSPIEAAAFFFGGLTAADFLLDQCALQPGERLLIVGATGAVGSAAVQIARHCRAHVTALTRAENRDLATALGAHCVHDYRSPPQTGQFDVILDVPGVLPNALDRLAPGGRLGLVTATLAQMLGALLRPKRRGNRWVRAGVVKETPAAVARLLDLHTAGGYRPLVGEIFPFTDIQKAYAQADSGHKRGNLVLNIGSSPPQTPKGPAL